MFSQHHLYSIIAKPSESAMIEWSRSSTDRKVVQERDRKAEEFVSPAVPWGTRTFTSSSDPMSQRPALEPNLSATPEQLSALLDCARELLAILSTDGIIVHASAGSTRALGLGPDELIGRAIWDLVHPDDVGETRERLRGIALLPNETRKGRCRLRCKSGEWRWFEA